MTRWATVNVEGGLFPADILDAVAAGTADGQRPADFRLEAARLLEELQAAFADARSYWDAFQRRLARRSGSVTSLTREAWMLPLLERLGFDLEYQPAALSAGNSTYTISHLHGKEPGTPVHIVSFDQELDKSDAGGRRSPNALVQEYLNRTDALWGLVTNGRKLRLLRDTERMAKPSYVEFDLEGMIESDKYSEFALLYRLLHATRFPLPGSDPAKCWLETYYQQGNDLGGRVREGMRDGVSAALEVLGNAFLKHDDNERLREAFRSGRLSAGQYYRQLLRLVYRFLFLMVTEERGLVFPEEEAGSSGHLIYDRYYSISRLRERAERYYAEDRHYDLWEGVKSTFALFREDALARKLGLRALDGELFGEDACADLEACRCLNADLLRAVRELSTYRQEKGPRRRVNFRDIDVEEFGSVYESLLEYHPVVDVEGQSFSFLSGNERKSTGSYYMPSSLVQELVQSALVPVLEERVAAAKTRDEKAAAILSMRVIDPAAGSGHFLLAAARRMARELARVRTDEAEPSVEDYRRALRDVIRNCIYAVDKNPLAVDLCKVALWIEGHNAGLPLGFLDHHIKLGDSLVGVFDLAVLEDGIPDDAYKPVTGDDKAAARYWRDLNKKQRAGQLRLAAFDPEALERSLAPDFAALGELEDDSPPDVRAKQELYARLRAGGSQWWRLKVACDLWTYAFFAPLEPQPELAQQTVPTTALVWEAMAGGTTHAYAQAKAMAESAVHPYFHWPLEFPDVFADRGFEVVLGNPPWENIRADPVEFFAGIHPSIVSAPSASLREQTIQSLREARDPFARMWDAHVRSIEGQQLFVGESDRFPYGASGKTNTMPLFLELFSAAISKTGRSGIIVKSVIGTDLEYQRLFEHLVEEGRLYSFYDFINEQELFPAVHRQERFALVTLAPPGTVTRSKFRFLARATTELQDSGSIFELSGTDLRMLTNGSCRLPTISDSTLLRILRAVAQSAKGSSFLGPETQLDSYIMFDSGAASSAKGGCTLPDYVPGEGNNPLEGTNRFGEAVVAVYEGKLFGILDHRLRSFEGIPVERRYGKTPATYELTIADKEDPNRSIEPRYWVPKAVVKNKLNVKGWSHDWILVHGRKSNRDNKRTFSAAFIPLTASVDLAPVLLPTSGSDIAPVLRAAAVSQSFSFDFLIRSRLIGFTIGKNLLEEIPVPSPARFSEASPWGNGESIDVWCCTRVLELTYTAFDLTSLARDLGFPGPPFLWDEERRFLLRCELDAAFFHLYGIERADVDYIMETFPIVRREDEKQFGEFRTKRVILEMYDQMAEAVKTGRPYQTWLDPPPADPRVAHTAVGGRA
ncbi:MAG TPA: N-6 DNA methylase [Dehalococcoidia bacterium]|nr:N-6 DNA methylase [Dehalococcoidia bacterium]